MMLTSFKRITRRLRAVLALGIAATWCATAGAVGLVYVDAVDDLGAIPGSPYVTGNEQNLFAASGGPLSDALDAIGGGANYTDGKWGYRDAGFGARGTIYETANESAPEIYQVITGLTPNASYDVYVAYWSSEGGNWAIRAGATSNPDANPVFDRTGALGTRGYPALYAAFDVLPQDNWTASDEDGAGVLTQTQNAVTMEGNRYMLLGPAALNLQANGAGEVRIYLDDVSDITNERSFFDGLAYAPAGTPIAVYAEVDRTTGNVTIHNPTDQDFRVARLGVGSVAGTLDAREWITIAGNTDANGDSSRDTDPWIVTNPNPANPTPSHTTSLREIEVDDDMMGLDSNGALIASGTSISLGNIWHQSPYEDLVINMATLLDATASGGLSPTQAVPIVVNFINGTPIEFGDFNYDGNIDVDDYQILLSNMHRSFNSISITEAFAYGDMNGDRVLSFTDLQAFATAYDDANGAGAFLAMSGMQVPEPGTVALFGLAGMGLVLRRRLKYQVPVVAGLLVTLVAASTSIAQTLTYIDAEPSNTVLENGGPLNPTADTTGNILLAQGANTTDGKWGVRPFGNQSIAPWGFNGSNFTVFEAFSATETVDRLITTFTLPDTGLYHIYGFIWDDQPGTGWDADFQLGSRPVQSYKPLADGVSFEAADFLPNIVGMTATLVPGIGTVTGDPLHDIDQPNGMPGNRNLYAAPLGIWSGASDGTSVSVTVGTGPSTERTWYDGVGYAPVVDPILLIEVNRSTGEVTLSNTFGAPIELSYYQIGSQSGSLDRTAWNSLDDQNIDASGGGGLLDGWDETGSDTRLGDFNGDGSVDAADYTVWRNGFGEDYTAQDYVDWKANYGESGPLTSVDVLSEVNLFGSTTIAGNSSISLGNIYNTDIDGQDLTFSYGLVADGTLTPTVALYTGAPGSLLAAQSVPEPGTWALGMLAGLACAGFARRRNRA
jgi:hypothetical protein